ncbi:S1 family peptidase [Promicromonospora iranensis]|uniref:Streptogrisin C n=1 Tax=Promicromonospora iranensis TaxID=1105144 RepID=A0ABU2CNJ4_9MICO|nr:S1 family peptidase [Promicromonospora iranensis]MDR7382915.1 streptogrisin C [Promicromonospora iranensis]
MSRTSLRGLAVATATVGLFVGTINAVAAAQPDTEAAASQYAPGMVAAMERDLGLSTTEAVAQIKAQEALAGTQRSLEKSLGATYAGAWVEGADELHVAVTDTADAAAVRAAGATPVAVDNSLAALDAWTADLDGALSESDVTSYHVDVETNEIVVDVVDGAQADVEAAIVEAGVPADAVSLSTAAERPTTLINVVGGNAYYIGGSRCSVGFSATGGFVTAGHCGSRGATTSQPSGTFQVSSFPGNDYAYVNTGTDDTLIGAVNNYRGGTVNVTGSSPAAVGSTVCRSGSTTGWHCGTIQALNATVNYAQGSVYGLIRTNVCAEPGDSGGSLLAGTQAQGMTSGGSGNCSSGGTTFFQPVGEALRAAGVSLVTR